MRLCSKWLAAILLLSTLTGCWGAREIEHMVYPNTFGVDYKDNKVYVYLQFISFSGVAKTESGESNKEETFYVGKGEGGNLDEAIFNLYASSQQRISWSHLKSIVITAPALKQGLIVQLVDLFDRYYEFRYTQWIMATHQSLDEVFSTPSNVDMSIVYSQLNNPKDSYSQSSWIAPLYLHRFIWMNNEKSYTVLLPLIKVDKDRWFRNDTASPRIIVDGVCVMYNRSYTGDLRGGAMQGIRWMEKKTERTPLNVASEGKDLGMLVVENLKNEVKSIIEDHKPYFDVYITGEANIPFLLQTTSEHKFKEAAEHEIARQVKESYAAGVDIGGDVLHLADNLLREKPEEWHRLKRTREFPLESDSLRSVHVNIRIKSAGISKMRIH
ncbi:Ger(x)C family spore germination protein [Paenibacillus aquistagni]|uniref:Ger(x)C family spore germination protein n=1 Tax=Paenibacillus aquistagni TaxID=1852522 RepID=UPI000B4FDB0F|nr:Ger(x)C family spore germination protein [Paenibacillus aquistagni]